MEVYNVIGLMSGTSLDGLDMAYCVFKKSSNKWSFTIEKTSCVEYDAQLKQKLAKAIELSEEQLLEFDHDYGDWIGAQVNRFIRSNKLVVDFIASHGHTIHHKPAEGYTFQAGNGARIAQQTGVKTIADFRSLDVSLGGQGAPLVPIGDQKLFDSYDFCLNLGGISNISYDDSGVRKAFDVSIANMLLNDLSLQLGFPYDSAGTIASKGKVDQELLTSLNQLNFYKETGPKSIGFEWYISAVKPLFQNASCSLEDQLRTSVEHIAFQLAKTIKTLKYKGSILISGGGAFNDFLILRLKAELGVNYQVFIPNPTLIAYKEALIFAFMGVLTIREENNCLSSVTGAKHDSCSGVVFE